MIKWLAFTVALIVSTNVLAQLPVIDSMRVDERARKLVLHGKFGAVQGNVFVDSVALAVKSWSSEVIVALISDTGKGSIGAVIVEAEDVASDPRMLSMLRLHASDAQFEMHSIPFENEIGMVAFQRVDLTSLIVERGRLALPLHRRSYVFVKYSRGNQWDQRYGYDVRWRTDDRVDQRDSASSVDGFDGLMTVDLQTNTISCTATDIRGMKGRLSYIANGDAVQEDFEHEVSDFSHRLNIERGFETPIRDSTIGDPRRQTRIYRELRVQSPPSDSVLVLISEIHPLPPMLRAAQDVIVDLSWLGVSSVTGYEVEVSATPSFDPILTKMNLKDTTIRMPLPYHAQYFWRVRAKNRYGETKWIVGQSFAPLKLSVRTVGSHQPAIRMCGETSICFSIGDVSKTINFVNVLGQLVLSYEMSGAGSYNVAQATALGAIFAWINSNERVERIRIR